MKRLSHGILGIALLAGCAYALAAPPDQRSAPPAPAASQPAAGPGAAAPIENANP